MLSYHSRDTELSSTDIGTGQNARYLLTKLKKMSALLPSDCPLYYGGAVESLILSGFATPVR